MKREKTLLDVYDIAVLVYIPLHDLIKQNK